MSALRQPARDPRTVARDIPGILDALFPQLVAGVVTHLNRGAVEGAGSEAIPVELIASCSLQHAMLFEIAVAASEQLISGGDMEIESALRVAVRRQQRHFDARLPDDIPSSDRVVIEKIARNTFEMLEEIRRGIGADVVGRSPHVPGFMWVASGAGDFSIGNSLIEIKCTAKMFSSSDYRQVLMYWLLSYASSVEGGVDEWRDVHLVNPRLNRMVHVSFDEVVRTVGAGRSKVQLLELFSSLVGDHGARMLSEMQV